MSRRQIGARPEPAIPPCASLLSKAMALLGQWPEWSFAV